MRKGSYTTVTACALALAMACGQPLISGSSPGETPPGESPEGRQDAEPKAVAAAADCAAGVVKDDGDPETGYGFVPSATDGIYVQEIDAAELPRRELAKVCVCFLKTRGASDAEFEVVFYEDAGGRPAEEPYASVPGKATDLPNTKETAGRFYEGDVAGATFIRCCDPTSASSSAKTGREAGTASSPPAIRSSSPTGRSWCGSRRRRRHRRSDGDVNQGDAGVAPWGASPSGVNAAAGRRPSRRPASRPRTSTRWTRTAPAARPAAATGSPS